MLPDLHRLRREAYVVQELESTDCARLILRQPVPLGQEVALVDSEPYVALLQRLEDLLELDPVVCVARAHDRLEDVLIIHSAIDHLGPDRLHDAVGSIPRLARHHEARRAGALSSAGFALKLLAVHQEEAIAFVVPKDVHEKLAVVMEASCVFVQWPEQCTDLLIVRAGHAGVSFDLSESVVEGLNDHLVVQVPVVKPVSLLELNHETS